MSTGRWPRVIPWLIAPVVVSLVVLSADRWLARLSPEPSARLAAGMTPEPAPKRTPNRLIREKSPYLLQHAHNPVDWYEWGEEAFAEARRQLALDPVGDLLGEPGVGDREHHRRNKNTNSDRDPNGNRDHGFRHDRHRNPCQGCGDEHGGEACDCGLQQLPAGELFVGHRGVLMKCGATCRHIVATPCRGCFE